jgi:hypothetical protein
MLREVCVCVCVWGGGGGRKKGGGKANGCLPFGLVNSTIQMIWQSSSSIPVIPLGTQGVNKTSPSGPISGHPLNFAETYYVHSYLQYSEDCCANRIKRVLFFNAISLWSFAYTKAVQNLSNDVLHLQLYGICSPCGIYLQKPLNHMPNVVKIITERASELAAMDKVVYYFNPRVSLIPYGSTE